MSVKITYTVDYSDVPREANFIATRACNRLKELVSLLDEAIATQDYNKKIQAFDSIRQQMILADLNLEDSYNIYIGYMKHELESKIATGEETLNAAKQTEAE